MHQKLALLRGALCLSLFAVASGCDGASTPAPPPTEASHSQTLPNPPSQGGVAVEMVLNHPPQVIAMQSSDGRVESFVPVALQAVASDPDGDALGFVWKSACPGAFDHTDLAQVAFTAGDLGGVVSCTFEVEVGDGHGGFAKGTLVLTAVAPTINVAPQMGVAYQSTAEAASGEIVILHASATDPEGEALAWTWQCDDGTFSHQIDDAYSSDVHWTAPAAPGTTYAISATATDPEGAEASFVFTVKVGD